MEGTEISHIPLSSYTHSLPINIAHQNGTLVTVDEPALTYHHRKLTLGFTVGVV